METGRLLVGVAIFGAAAYFAYNSCLLKGLGLAPTTCGTTTTPSPVTNPVIVKPKGNCVPLYGSIGPDQLCCKEDGTCCAKGSDAIVKNSTCYPKVPTGTSMEVKNKSGHTTESLDVEMKLRTDGNPVYVDSAFPILFWSVSDIPGNQWCRANVLAQIVEVDGSISPWISVPYEAVAFKDTNGMVDPGGTTTLSFIQRPIRGFVFELVLHVASGFAGCGFGTQSYNILDKVQVRFQ